MPHIAQLESHVADLIAAGEVVERPASVVKELLENAVDAGACAVTAEIQNGGMGLIRVTDNGCGIAPDEAATAFLRHATSKIRGERDLEAIGTLGFRGEALAAIAAVSRVSLLTRPQEAALGVCVSLEGGVVTDREEAGCPAGSTLLVRDLFYNTPARLKFVKKDAAEGAAVFAAVQRLALSHPEVSFQFLRDGKQELLTPGDGLLQSAVYSVLGRDLALGLLPVSGSGEDLSVAGFTSLPACCRGTRGYQHFFVNGRYVRSRTMAAALEEAYKNQKMVGKFPACVLHLTTRLSAMDVNVHPTKTEVKFSSDRRVFDAVYYAVLSALGADHSRPPAVAERRPAPSAPPVEQTKFHTMTAAEYQKTAAAPSACKAPGAARGVPSAPSELIHRALPLHDCTAPSTPTRSAAPVSPVSAPPAAAEPAPVAPPLLPEPVDETPWRLVGEVLSTYLIVEQGDRVLFLDKHAAHERMNFDKLKAADYRPMVQTLLTPAVFTPPAEEGAALLAQLELLAEFGFEAGDFGGGAIAVRAAPDYVDAGEIESVLTALGGELLAHGRADPAGARDALLHSMACKAAIKGGQKNDTAELLRVAEAVMSGTVKYCPHGRPVAVTLSRAQLEKQFKRA